MVLLALIRLGDEAYAMADLTANRRTRGDNVAFGQCLRGS
jgi:hypothetical protein